MRFAPNRTIQIVLLLAIAVACGTWGGPDNRFDVGLVRDGVVWRAASAWPTTLGRVLNIAGGAAMTIGLTVAATAWLWWKRGPRAGLTVMAVVLGGRVMVDLIKDLVQRPRPALDLHPVTTHSLSFPSAHAGNSMIAFCALALVLAPARQRRSAVIAALLASLAVGASRPMLGVHWPSDVVAGWAVGAAWLLAWWPPMRRLFPDEAQHDVVGGHRAAAIQE